MGNHSQQPLKLFKWIIGISLFLWAVWFSKDVFTKYQAKVTNFKTNSEKNGGDDVPTTVLCFTPLAKNLSYYNVRLVNLLNPMSGPIKKLSVSWDQFRTEAFYKIGHDFMLNYGSDDSVELSEGKNIIGTNKYIMVEQIMTFVSGLCYKITFSYLPQSYSMDFKLNFNQSLGEDNIPIPMIYLTSEQNSEGIYGMNWANGEELKFTLEHSINYYTLNVIKKIYLGENLRQSSCRNREYRNCIVQTIADQSNYSNCTTFCLPITIPEITNNTIPTCTKLHHYNCMRTKMYTLLLDAAKKCPKFCIATEYYGKLTHDINLMRDPSISWQITISENIDVHEEYLVYDVNGLIGSVGGTLGLFCGASFADVIFFIIDYLWNMINKK